MLQSRNDDWAGRRVTVMGLGRFGGGVGVTRWLASQGATVTVTDLAGDEQLRDSLAELADLDLTLHLGRHEEADFVECDALVVNPAVPFDSPYLDLSRRAEAEITTEINLFLARCPAPVVGITGSVGKSTTTAMAGAILTRAKPTYVGGNIGVSLLGKLDDISPEHVIVLELSSFQLAYLPLVETSPQVAVVTNLHPNHLDRHASLAEYAQAKKNIFRYQHDSDILILNRKDREVASWKDEAPSRVEFFAEDDDPFELKLQGAHNQANAQAAWAAARQFDVSREAAAQALALFPGLPHRLQFIREQDGIRYFNDSKCTTPAGTIAALQSFPPRSAVVIVGGYDKHIDFRTMCAALACQAKGAVVTGQTGDQIAKGIERARAQDAVPMVIRTDALPEALRAAGKLAQRGDVVLLSPACASYDQFTNYQERGEAFVRLVENI